MAPESPNPIRVLVVDDSFFMRKMLQDMLGTDESEIKVVDTAQNGMEAVEKARKLKPDVITLDVEMPKMDGLTALERIMDENPIPVLMLSSHTGEGTSAAIRALELGAVDCLAKPAGHVLENIKEIQGELIEKIKAVSIVKPRKRKALDLESQASVLAAKPPKAEEIPEEVKPATFIVAIAASTGGPRALNELFTYLRYTPSAAYLIVQHISVGFTKALARRLGDVSSMAVAEAVEGETLMGGQVYLAPGGRHIVLAGFPGCYQVAFNDDPPRFGIRPAADIMMASVAKIAGKSCMGVVLTGMGHDGTAGLKGIRAVGGRTFAQDAESCVVYGMPKSAVDAGLVDRQLTLPKMAEEINTALTKKN